jgi:gamma-glutamyltranspeptidase / glutathione hydrolase
MPSTPVGSGRHPVTASQGIVSSGHPLAASTALQQLMTGGNAIDAILAASAVQCVVEMPWCSLGGDLFLSVFTPETGVLTLNGAGSAPAGIESIVPTGAKAPRYGPASIAVPGLPQAWDLAWRRFATKPRSDLLAQAINYAAEGFPVYERMATAAARVAKASDHAPSFKLVLGEGDFRTGAVFRQPDLTRTLEAFASEGSDPFYRGAIADRITNYVSKRGGALSSMDLAEHRVAWSEPLHCSYRGYEVFEHPLTSLGCLLLEELRILEGFDLRSYESGNAELIDLLVRCKEAAFSDSARLGDGTHEAVAEVLSDERTEYWRERIRRASPLETRGALPAGADTTSTVVADGNGNVACLIQSLFNEWGSRELVDGTGILLNDRLANMANDPASVNRLRGGSRPLHTLNTYMVCKDGTPVMAGATPGGRGQVQINLQVIVNAIDLGMDTQQAVEAPRWISGGAYRGLSENALYIEPAMSAETIAGLRSLGRAVETDSSEADLFGNCTVVARDPETDALFGAADPRRDGAAVGW